MNDISDMVETILRAAKNRPVFDPEADYARRRDAHIARRGTERASLALRISKPILDALAGAETPSALFLGKSGIGKSSASKWLLAGRKYKFTDCQELAAAEMGHPLGKGEAPEVYHSKTAKLLIVDDVGTGKRPDALQVVLRYRDNRQLPTIVNTGLTARQLSEWLGAPYVRRIAQQHAGRPVLIVNSYKDEKESGGK